MATVGFSTASTASSDSDFIDEYSYAIAHFFDDDSDRSDLRDDAFDALDYVCYAYGMIEETDEADSSEEWGYLSGLTDLVDTSEIADWAAENLGYIAYFVEKLNVISDEIARK